jgi:hypothetical protein
LAAAPPFTTKWYSPADGFYIPGWMGTGFSLFNNWEKFIGQAIALLLGLTSSIA